MCCALDASNEVEHFCVICVYLYIGTQDDRNHRAYLFYMSFSRAQLSERHREE